MANNNIMLLIKHNIESAKKSWKSFNDEVDETYPELVKAKKGSEDFKNSIKQWGQVAKGTGLIGWIGTLKEGLDMLTKYSSKQADYIEDLNFLDQAYNNSAESGLRLLDTLEKTVGYDPAGLTRQLASFRQLGNALEIDDKVASRLAENLIKLSVDTKSITGSSLDTVTSKYMAAMAGNTRAVRTYGIDITQAGLQQQALNLGIEKSVTEMTRAEKSILTYISMARQMSSANGDLARTVNSTANQYEIFKNQISETGRLLGGFLIPILKTVLPLVNGVLMAVNVLVNSLLSLFGIDASSLSQEFGTVAVDLGDVSDGFDSVGDSATKAGKAAKEAQKSLRGFDKLNVIKTPTSASGGGGGSVGGGGISGLGAIDSSLLDKLSEYDLHLDQISNKATEIRDSIMEWLGFTKLIDPITGDISWEYQGLGTTIRNIGKTLWELPLPLKIIAGIGIAKGLSTIFTIGKSLLSVVLKPFAPLLTKVGTGITKLLSPMASLVDTIKVYKQLGAMEGITSTKDIINEGTLAWQKRLGIMDKVKVSAIGLTGVFLGSNGLASAYKSMALEGQNLGNSLQAAASGFASMAGGAMTGFAWAGPTGAAIGAITGGLISLITALDGLGQRRDVIGEFVEENGKRLDSFTESLQAQYEQVEKNASLDITKAIVGENLVSELEKITDSNGKVQEGYESRAKFIIDQLQKAYGIEIKMIDGVVQKRDEQIGKVKELIENEKARIYQRLAEEKYEIAIRNQTDAENELIKARARRKTIEDELNETQIAYNKAVEEGASGWVISAYKKKLNDLTINYNEMNEQVNKATSNLAKNEQAISNYTGLSTAIIEGDQVAIEKYERLVQQSFTTTEENLSESLQNRLALAYDYGNLAQEVYGTTYDNLTEQQKQFLDRRKQEVIQELIDEAQSVDGMSDTYIASWRRLAENSEQDFLNALGKLPTDVRQQVVDKMYPEGRNISQKLQEGINSLGVTITPKIKPPTQSEMRSIATTLGATMTSMLTIGVKANGGLYSSGIWRPMKTYANGGFPSQGEIFMAREKGPELVGRIGNSTAVMNNDQILDQMTIAVARGMSANNDKERPVQIIAEGDTEGMLDFITFKQISKNRQFGL